MNLTKSTLIAYILLAVIVGMLGFIINQYQTYQSKLAWWKQTSRSCVAVSQKQDRLIKSMLE